ncbi:MAG: prolyl oligopeptidase family serine peptidase, partial [Syntrophothermus sp.]
PQARPRLFYPRQPNLQYFIDDNGAGRFLVFSNDRAQNYKVDEVPVTGISKNNWKTIVPEREDIKIEEMFTFRNHLVLFEREKGKQRVEIINLNSRASRVIRFEEPVYAIKFDRNSDFSSNTLQVIYSSFIIPPTVVSYNLDTAEKVNSVMKREVPGYNPSLYSTEKIFARSQDGQDIPIVIVYKKGISRNGQNPMLLTGYGAYNEQNEPRFTPEIISLLDRGVIYGIAQIRGGGEIDDKWYEQGKLLNKKNTFTDFISCAEFLISSKYTSREKLAIHGRSAGGLLIGSVINMRPDLFKVAVPEMPFVDVINTMLDPTIFGTVEDYNEYGNPNYKIYYDYMKSYSPYDNVKKQKYPDMLIIGSMNDKRVSYWEPLKWTARLREMKTGESLLLLKLYDNASHKGASGVYENYKMHAFKYAFILDRLGIQG